MGIGPSVRWGIWPTDFFGSNIEEKISRAETEPDLGKDFLLDGKAQSSYLAAYAPKVKICFTFATASLSVGPK